MARRAEKVGLDHELWKLMVEVGFDSALLTVTAGGSGLSFREIGGVLAACGRRLAPIPLPEVIVGRAFAEFCGHTLPEGVGSAALAWADGSRLAAIVRWGRGTEWVLAVIPGSSAFVFASAGAKCSPTPTADCQMMEWERSSALYNFTPPEGVNFLSQGAAMRTAQIAGALEAVLELTVRFAADRQQFGRAISKFQAIQQLVAQLAEQCFLARMACLIACNSNRQVVEESKSGVGKLVASEAASSACAIAHAVHAAIGISEEYDLQLYTRRLSAWRTDFGSENYWGKQLGCAFMRSNQELLDFARGCLV